MLSSGFSVKDESTQVEHRFLIMSIFDLGFFINFIRGKYVPISARDPVPQDEHQFFGISNSHLVIFGLHKTVVKSGDIETEIRFAVVLNDKMAHAALLHRQLTINSIKNLC